MSEEADRVHSPFDWHWRPKRRGETHRICVGCGAEYEPRARTQKFCNECRPKHN